MGLAGWGISNSGGTVATPPSYSSMLNRSSTSGLTTIQGSPTILQPTSARLPIGQAPATTRAVGITSGTHNITIVTGGAYRISVDVTLANTAQTFAGFNVVSNNATILCGEFNGVVVNQNFKLSAGQTIDLVAGDILDVRIYSNAAGTTTTSYLGWSFLCDRIG